MARQSRLVMEEPKKGLVLGGRMRGHFNAWNGAFIIVHLSLLANVLIFGTSRYSVVLVEILVAVDAVVLSILVLERSMASAAATMLASRGVFCLVMVLGAASGWLHVPVALLSPVAIVALLGLSPAAAISCRYVLWRFFLEKSTGAHGDRGKCTGRLLATAAIASLISGGAQLVLFALVRSPRAIPVAAIHFLSSLATLSIIGLVTRCYTGEARGFYTPVLTHHSPEERDHAIGVTIGKMTVFFCTRCSGMLIGVSLFILAAFTFKIEVPSLVALISCILLPLPIFIDWGTQSLTKRKSTTKSRLMTGALAGLGIFLLTYSTRDYLILSAIALAVYFTLLFTISFIKMRRMAKQMDEEPWDDDFGLYNGDDDTFWDPDREAQQEDHPGDGIR